MNRTLLDECLRVQGRQTWYIDVQAIPVIVPTDEATEPLSTAACCHPGDPSVGQLRGFVQPGLDR